MAALGSSTKQGMNPRASRRTEKSQNIQYSRRLTGFVQRLSLWSFLWSRGSRPRRRPLLLDLSMLLVCNARMHYSCTTSRMAAAGCVTAKPAIWPKNRLFVVSLYLRHGGNTQGGFSIFLVLSRFLCGTPLVMSRPGSKKRIPLLFPRLFFQEAFCEISTPANQTSGRWCSNYFVCS